MFLQFGQGVQEQIGLCETADRAAFQQWYNQGEAHANAGRYRQALRCFEEALVLEPNNPETLVYQAVCLLHLEQPQPALTIAESLLGQDPNHAQGWLFRGVALHRLGRYKAAYASYNRAEALAQGVN